VLPLLLWLLPWLTHNLLPAALMSIQM